MYVQVGIVDARSYGGSFMVFIVKIDILDILVTIISVENKNPTLTS